MLHAVVLRLHNAGGMLKANAMLLLLSLTLFTAGAYAAETLPAVTSTLPWWGWALALFVTCFFLGIVAVPSGVGGGVLFVPIVGGFFPFHLDFVRGAGLLVALASSLPLAVLASASSIAGALVGLAIPSGLVQIALGVTILGIVTLMATAKKSEFPIVPAADRLSSALSMHGIFRDTAQGKNISWKVHRTPLGIFLFVFIGFIGGLFGVGAGWANLPVLNLLMGAPIKLAAGTSGLILTLASSSATWVYLNEGSVLAIIAVPSVIGMMLGAMIGARLLHVLKASVVRKMVISLLLFAGLRALLKGLGIWP
jgi:uncharacterized membrane protein YfcA